MAIIINLRNISAQFCAVFDYLFEPVLSCDDDMIVYAICNQLFENNWDLYAKDKFNIERELIYSSSSFDEAWLSEPEACIRQQEMLSK